MAPAKKGDPSGEGARAKGGSAGTRNDRAVEARPYPEPSLPLSSRGVPRLLLWVPALAAGKAGKPELASEELIFNESETCSLFDDDIVCGTMVPGARQSYG